MLAVYKTLYFSGNPNAEYQKRSGKWYKRKKSSTDNWELVDKQHWASLEKENKQGILFNITSPVKIIAVVGVVGLSYYFYKRYLKK